ncbi:MAG: secondary thiamine-phosphate synthase enzyme YjbQ, partial [Nanoarchaeota archaeon]|nr:secondary thiamine-phosphate synthase enzyme YjbQ [Nanoarchaeota archaeon]
MVKTSTISIKTKGNCDIVDLTGKIQSEINKFGFDEGSVLVFVSGSTAGLTTIEFEPDLEKDLKEFFERIVPSGEEYHHNARWGDGNGHSHVRASLLKPDLNVPFKDGKLLLGTWQQIVLVDFD